MKTVREVAPLIQKLTIDLENEINRIWDEYAEQRKEFSNISQQFITNTPTVDDVAKMNGLLKGIQDKFALLNIPYNFINYRYQYAANATKDFNDFIDNLIRAGAIKQDDIDEPLSIITS